MTTQMINEGRSDTQISAIEAKSPAKPRLFFVDNLRILLITLVVLHHLAITYGHSGGWYYYEGQPDDLATIVFTLLNTINQAFFLGFFYMISGYFTPGSYDRKGAGPFLKDRLLRLGIPLLFYIIVIDPLLIYALAVNVHNFEGSLWQFLARYFEACSNGYEVQDRVKRLVIYDFHNLKHENGLKNLDIIFCRNVLIYFAPEEQKKVLEKFIRALEPGGYLFLGHSESVLGLTDELEFVHHNKGTAYRKVSPS